jgi:phosphonate transport system permease protein
MTLSSKLSTDRKLNVYRSSNSALATILSAIIPGSGQLYLRKGWRSLIVFLTAVILGSLVFWSLADLKLATLQLGASLTSWLWIPFIAFWVWNVLDAHRLSTGERSNPALGILFAAIIIYFIAYQVTDVKLDRLVTRISDAQIVITDILNPEIFVTNVGGEDKVCSWDCLAGALRAKLVGEKPAGAIRMSENIYDIFGNVTQAKVPRWKVNLGFAKTGDQETTFVAGKMIETIAIGLMATIFSTILAIPISFLAAHNIMSRVPGGMVIYYVTRTILNIVRAIDTIVWGLIVIVWVGQGSFAGMIALTIHSVAALGKLFSEEIEHIDLGPVEAVTAAGANLIQTIRYSVIPQIVPPFLAYSLLRWDINMRSATVIGFVAGGGIGFFVVETVRQGAYQQYATALWAVVVVIILVDTISARWRSAILADQPVEKKPANPTFSNLKKWAYILLGVAAFIYCWNLTEISLSELFNPGKTFGRLVLDFMAIDLTPKVVSSVTQQMLVTIFQALLATTLGGIVALPFSFLAARNLTGRSRFSSWIYYLTRAMFNILRSIEALLYVAIFVFWVGIGPFAGMMALAVTTFALIGKLFSEAIENIDSGPMEALTSTGADRLQVIQYAVLPQIVPPFVSYLIYQWDINIRMATIIGFAGGGGIGLTLSSFFGSLQYHKAGTVVAMIVVVVAVMDLTSAKLREKLV